MILSVSRRTDIPRFYFNWFLNRLKEGYVLVRNPLTKVTERKINMEAILQGELFADVLPNAERKS